MLKLACGVVFSRGNSIDPSTVSLEVLCQFGLGGRLAFEPQNLALAANAVLKLDRSQGRGRPGEIREVFFKAGPTCQARALQHMT